MKHFKILSTSVAVLAMMTNLSANGFSDDTDDIAPEVDMGNDSMFKTGGYGSLNLGFDNFRYRLDTAVAFNPGPVISAAQNVTHNKSSFAGELAIGTQYVTGSAFTTAFEIAFRLATGKVTNKTGQTLLSTQTTTHRTTQRFSIIPSLLAGYVVSGSIMPYISVGLPITRVKHTITSTGNNDAGNAGVFTKSHFKFGIEPGLGVKYAITENIVANARATYAFGFGQTVVAGLFSSSIPASVASAVKKRRNFTFMVGGSYGMSFGG